MNVEAIQKINFKKVHNDMSTFSICNKQDELCIGTEHYQGLSYFHNYEYRHLLRGLGDYREWKVDHVKRPWHKSYKMIHDHFVKAGLETAGFSTAHTTIIAKVLNFDVDRLINIYHGEK